MDNFLIVIIALLIRVVTCVGAQLRLSLLTATKAPTPTRILLLCVVVVVIGGVVDAVVGLAVRVVAVDASGAMLHPR